MRIRWPSNAAEVGPFRPLPLSVARTISLEADTTVTVLDILLGTQMFEPSKMGSKGDSPTGIDLTTAPLVLSTFFSRLSPGSVTQMKSPS